MKIQVKVFWVVMLCSVGYQCGWTLRMEAAVVSYHSTTQCCNLEDLDFKIKTCLSFKHDRKDTDFIFENSLD
jgi:hypothetical protein